MEQQRSGSDLVDLGPVTKVTRGAWGEFSDEILMQHMPGLSND
jgi:hypothetical protein